MHFSSCLYCRSRLSWHRSTVVSSDTSILPPLYIVLSIIGYAFWWLGDLGGQQWMTVEEDSLMRWQVMFQSLGAILFAASIIPTLALHQLFARDPSMYPIQIAKQALLWEGPHFYSCLISNQCLAHAAMNVGTSGALKQRQGIFHQSGREPFQDPSPFTSSFNWE